MALITIVTGAYKSTYNWGGPHCMKCYEEIDKGGEIWSEKFRSHTD